MRRPDFFTSILLLFLLTAAVSAQTNLVQNGDFSGGTSNWTLNQYGGSSSGSVVAGEYNIIITTAGTEHWHVQFIQTGIPLVQGQTYTFSFDAYKGPQNSGTQSMQVNIGQSNDPWTSYFGSQNQMVELTTTKTRYTYQITMTEPSDANARIEFNCGLSSGYFFIDNVSLMESSTPLLSITPQSIDFGTIAVGTPALADVTLQNNGTAPTTISTISSSLADVTATITTPITVPASGTETLPLMFDPSTTGTQSGTVTVYSNAADNPTIALSVTGTAENPGIIVTPTALSFSTAVNDPETKQLILSNTGSSSITWSVGSEPSWLSTVPAGGTIAAGTQTICSVTASTSASGTFSGILSLTHSAGNQPSPIDLPVTLSAVNGYSPSCPLIVNPDQAVDFMLDLIAFRMNQRDNTNGGFYTNIDRQGNWTGADEKALCGQSRIAYAFVRAFMVTGDEQYLEYARHALKFLYDHGWNNGWYFITDVAGNYVSHWGHNDWWSFQQHYALVGISAMVEATGGNINWNDGTESDHTWLMRGVTSNYNRLWDPNPATKGYYNYANTAWTSKWGKGFHSTVDGMTTHALLMSMMFDSTNHKNRLVELANNITDHLTGNMVNAAAGFPEMFNADWSIDYGTPSMDIGHGFKTSWVLQRAWLLNPDHPEYREAGHALMENLWDNGCYDNVYGAPFSYVNWQTGEITGMNKDFWMVEQGYTSGAINYYTAETQEQRDRYLQIADESLDFFLDHLVDPVYGESYNVVSRDGSTVVDGNKGGLFTAGYHSVELGYYAYLYSSLYYHQSPVQLYYNYPSEATERTYKLTPIAIEDDVLKITEVTLNGAPYTDFDSDARTLHLPAGTGGTFRVTFGFAPAVTHAITATAGTGGSIAPTGTITIPEGADQTFTITPAAGYEIGNVLVDGSSVGQVADYTFTNVTADHTIAAEFSALPTYTITATSAAGGSIAPSGATTVVQGGEQTYTISTAPGYRVLDVLVDGVSIGAVETYTFTSVSTDHTIDVSFEPVPTYTVTATATAGGSIDPSGAITVEEGADLTVTFSPQTGYSVTGIIVDGGSVPIAPSYTFSNVTGDHTIAVEFSINTYTITATASSGGSITPQGAISVQHGASQIFTITPSSGYEISSVTVDGSAIGAVSSYTFSSVSASHTINAVFAEPNPVVYQINTGSSTAPAPFSGDQYNSGGSTYSTTSAIDLSDVVDPAPQSVYQSERYGDCSYTIPNLTPSADYLVRLHFAEIYWTATGSRVFDVAIGGTTVLDNFDIYAVTGAQNKAVVREFTAAANGAGEITITITTVTDNAKISGIEVLNTIQDNPPTIVNAAAANPAQVDANTSQLSVLADDDNGEALLTYTWSATGNPPAPVAFSVNGTNAAKATTATFSEAGTYTLEVAASDQRGQSATSQVVVTVNQTLSSLTVSPAAATVNTAATQQFSASGTDQFGTTMSPQPTVSWTVDGGGTIAQNGLFTAGSTAGGPYTVTATSGSITAGATVTIVPVNQPPTVATAAAATPDPVTGTTTALSVLGADDNGEPNLSYTWATTGTPPAPVTFSVNGTNGSKNTTATFTNAGSYSLQVTIRDQGNLTVTSSVTLTVNQTLSTITVTPATATVNTSATQQFSASSVDQFGNAMSPQPSISWSTSGGGTISASGLFTAGTTPGGPYTVTAQTGALSASATVTVTELPTVEYQINTGSSSAPAPFTGDQYQSGGSTYSVTSSIDLSDVADPAPQTVYQSERYGDCSYTIPNLTPSADYLVRLHFAEIYWTATGDRVFNVAINGTTVLNNFDIFAVTGARYKAVVREFTAAANGSGQIVITFSTVTDNAKVSGIEVLTTVQDNPPFIVNEAAADPEQITGTTTQLSVLADDDNGEASLTYTWSTVGSVPAPVTFSANGTNAAKTTTAAFQQAGSYTLEATATDQRNQSVTSSVAVTVNQTLSEVTVTPATATIPTSASQQFSAAAVDQFGDPMSPQPSISWSVDGGGTISATGLFTAGSTAGGPYTVSAQSDAATGTAAVTVNEEPATLYQINTGSNSAVAPYSADQYGSGGTLRTVSDAIDMSGVTGTDPAPQNVYKSERYGNSTYTIPGLTPGNQYTVRLHFAELYQTAVGARLFNVAINGSTVLSNFDIYATTGARYKALIEEFTATANGSGQIVITFTTITDNATIEGIEIVQ